MNANGIEYSQLEFREHLEYICRLAVTRNRRRAWNEDHISYELVRDLSEFLGSAIIDSPRGPILLETEAWKLDGNEEYDHGDIAILFDIERDDDVHLRGVALLEAKRTQSSTRGQFNIESSQLDRILRNTPTSHLLLYDTQRNKSFASNRIAYRDRDDELEINDRLEWSFVSCVSTRTALAIAKWDRNLYPSSVPFSMLFTEQYIHGINLEYSDRIINAVTRWSPLGSAEEILGLEPKYLLEVRRSQLVSAPREPRPPFRHGDEWVTLD
jgi:hypothetical protein